MGPRQSAFGSFTEASGAQDPELAAPGVRPAGAAGNPSPQGFLGLGPYHASRGHWTWQGHIEVPFHYPRALEDRPLVLGRLEVGVEPQASGIWGLRPSASTSMPLGNGALASEISSGR